MVGKYWTNKVDTSEFWQQRFNVSPNVFLSLHVIFLSLRGGGMGEWKIFLHLRKMAEKLHVCIPQYIMLFTNLKFDISICHNVCALVIFLGVSTFHESFEMSARLLQFICNICVFSHTTTKRDCVCHDLAQADALSGHCRYSIMVWKCYVKGLVT